MHSELAEDYWRASSARQRYSGCSPNSHPVYPFDNPDYFSSKDCLVLTQPPSKHPHPSAFGILIFAERSQSFRRPEQHDPIGADLPSVCSPTGHQNRKAAVFPDDSGPPSPGLRLRTD